MNDDTSAMEPEPRPEPRGDRLAKDMEQWKERVSFSLDQRQIFFLCFGAALVASLLFVLGVMLGKRLEARTHEAALPPPDVADVFEKSDRPTRKSSHEGTVSNSPGGGTVSPPPAPAVAPAAPSAGAVPVPPSTATTGTAAPPAGSAAAPASSATSGAAATQPSAGKGELGTTTKTARGRYTLQLSSFQDRAEAEAFLKRFEGSGQKLFIIAADIPGRGVWYRVRLGEFASEEAAQSAKTEFEKKHGVIAYVMRY